MSLEDRINEFDYEVKFWILVKSRGIVLVLRGNPRDCSKQNPKALVWEWRLNWSFKADIATLSPVVVTSIRRVTGACPPPPQ